MYSVVRYQNVIFVILEQSPPPGGPRYAKSKDRRRTITASPQFSGDFVDRVTPVPIPNTVVKPVGADDTAAFSCGKVGSRRIYIKKPVQKGRAFLRPS
jgi:hypothetical protein